MTYISWSSDFALYLEDYLMYVHHTLGYDPRFDLKLMLAIVTYILWSIDFEDFLMY